MMRALLVAALFAAAGCEGELNPEWCQQHTSDQDCINAGLVQVDASPSCKDVTVQRVGHAGVRYEPRRRPVRGVRARAITDNPQGCLCASDDRAPRAPGLRRSAAPAGCACPTSRASAVAAAAAAARPRRITCCTRRRPAAAMARPRRPARSRGARQGSRCDAQGDRAGGRHYKEGPITIGQYGDPDRPFARRWAPVSRSDRSGGRAGDSPAGGANGPRDVTAGTVAPRTSSPSRARRAAPASGVRRRDAQVYH